MTFATFNLEEYPIVQITFDGAPASQDEMNHYLAQFEGLLLAAASPKSSGSDADAESVGSDAAVSGSDAAVSGSDAAVSGSDAAAADASVGVGVGSDAAVSGSDASVGVGVGIKFIIDLGIMSVSSSARMMLYLPQQVDFIQRLHRDNALVDAIAATAIVVRNDVARRVVEWVLRLVELRKPFAAVSDAAHARYWLR